MALKKQLNIIFVFFSILNFLVGCSGSKQLAIQKYPVYFEDKITLGNFEQGIIIRGADKNNPIMIHLHGGPGYPLFPYLDNFTELEKHFTMVYWEQRGTGSSLNLKLNSQSMQTDSLLRDLNELVSWVQQNFSKNKVYIWGHSWGTNLGMLYVNKHPEKVKAYIGTGQSVNLFNNERSCLEFVKQKATATNNKKALRDLIKIDTNNYELNDALKVRKWIYKYGGIVHLNYEEKPYINFGIVKRVFKTKNYGFTDKWGLMLRSKYSGKQLWDDMMAINLNKQVKQVNCPVYFFEGKYDRLVSSKIAAKYYNMLKATKGKKLVWFNKSAHRPHIEEPEKFISEIIKAKHDIK